MDILILNAVEAGACVDEDASNLVASLATLAGKHAEGSGVFVDGVKGCLRVQGLAGGSLSRGF